MIKEPEMPTARPSEEEVYRVMADMLKDGSVVESGYFRKMPTGAYQKVLVLPEDAMEGPDPELVRRLLIEIPGGHIVVTRADAVRKAADITVDSELAGTWYQFTKGRFEGVVGRMLGVAHEAELSPESPEGATP